MLIAWPVAHLHARTALKTTAQELLHAARQSSHHRFHSPPSTIAAHWLTPLPFPTTTVSYQRPDPVSHESHDVYEPRPAEQGLAELTQQPEQSQHLRPPVLPDLPRARQSPLQSTSSSSLPRSLRRSPRLVEQQLLRPRAASADPLNPRQHTVRFADEPTQSLETSPPRRASSAAPHPALRISRRTAAAIIFALEDALRKPNPFTPDLIEENASMSDLVGGPTGNGRVPNGGARAATGPVPVSTGQPQAVRTPTDIMRQRRARQAAREKQDADAAAAAAEEQRRSQEDELRRTASRRAQAVGFRGQLDPAGYPPIGATSTHSPQTQTQSRVDPNTGYARPRVPAQTSEQQASYSQARPPQQTSRVRGSSVSQDQPRAVPQQASPSVLRTQPTQTQRTYPQNPQQAADQSQQPSNPGQSETQQRRSNTSSFPHAFERWEDLSARWEGLTSHLIRRMEVNAEEVRRDPLAQQMSRQITDLSAAGANLFHAVVELQRLRASSERKFQRWFFETRAEQERAQETQAQLESQLQTERSQRAEQAAQPDMSGIIARAEEDSKNAHRMVNEMRRELQISKEEARRAWEELGRRAQEERDRTASLREGQPTLVGGVHVMPMSSGMGRGANVPPSAARDDPYQTAHMGTPGQHGDSSYASYDAQEQSPTDTDPFTEGVRTTQAQAAGGEAAGYPVYPPGVTPATSGSTARTTIPATSAAPSQFYRQPDASLLGSQQYAQQQRNPGTSEQSYALSDEPESEYEIDDHGNFILDAHGRRIPYNRSAVGSMEARGEHLSLEQRRAMSYGAARSAAAAPPRVPGPSHRTYLGPTTLTPSVDYEAADYGEDVGWSGPQGAYHPTRLSDVLEEEDERSKGSPSRASEASRGVY